MNLNTPRRGEIYLADLDPVEGHEQSGQRPFLVLSVRAMNEAPWRLAIGVPTTTTDRGGVMHVRLEPTESGLDRVTYALPEMVRSVSAARFRKLLGRAPVECVNLTARRTGVLLGLGRTRH
ncbi:MAG TPA: type II toxin-antitoxin system PemK/MazF family toxin [Solirubrobacterales bacterium]|nr:type II toxin-antitoxin system PemK/MazF family toxin [Solirubrobacterales bacterium]